MTSGSATIAAQITLRSTPVSQWTSVSIGHSLGLKWESMMTLPILRLSRRTPVLRKSSISACRKGRYNSFTPSQNLTKNSLPTTCISSLLSPLALFTMSREHPRATLRNLCRGSPKSESTLSTGQIGRVIAQESARRLVKSSATPFSVVKVARPRLFRTNHTGSSAHTRTGSRSMPPGTWRESARLLLSTRVASARFQSLCSLA